MLSLDLEEPEDVNWVDDDRIHHIDNLRTTLTVILIVQHTIVENASTTPGFHSLPISVFVLLCKTVIPGLFYFISGYAASVSRENAILQPGAVQGDGEFLWRRTKRLFLPSVAYATYGQVALWMVLTRSWPLVFGGVGSTSDIGFAKLQGPVAYLIFLYFMDIAHVVARPSDHKTAATRSVPVWTRSSVTPPEQVHSARSSHFTVKSTKGWYALSAKLLAMTSVYSIAAACGGRSEGSFLRLGFGLATYDTIVPAAPFQFILAYMAGTQLYRWQRYIVIPSPFAFPAFAFAVSSSISFVVIALMISPSFAELIKITPPRRLHPSFTDAGVNFHTILFAAWNAYAFFAISVTLVSIYAQWGWTRRDWGIVSRTSYVPVWVHMVPVIVFTRLLGADVGGRVYPGAPLLGAAPPAGVQQNLEWRCVLVATGATICSWFIGLGLAGLAEVLC